MHFLHVLKDATRRDALSAAGIISPLSPTDISSGFHVSRMFQDPAVLLSLCEVFKQQVHSFDYVKKPEMNNSLSAAKRYLEQLSEDVDKNQLVQPRRDEILVQLKFLGRDAKLVTALFDASGLKVLGHYALGEYPRSTSREALRCIANSLLLVPATQETFAELGFVPKAAESYKLQDNLDEFLLARVLFLMTYTRTTDLANLIEEHGLAESLAAHIKRHADTPALVPKTDVDAVTAISETLKLLFNVTNAVPQLSHRLNPAVPQLFKILVRYPIPIPALGGGQVYIVNALANLDIPDCSSPELDHDIKTHLTPAVERLLGTLNQGLKSYTEAQLDTQAIPLLTVIRKINESADLPTRQKLQSELLPKDTERDLPLGQSSSLASRLLKLTTSPGLLHLPEVISSLLFELSDKDATTFVKNIGYGYAAGYLMSHKIPIPQNANSGTTLNTDTDDTNGQIPVNPVTGQRLDRETHLNLPEMTQEEKEREAERLYVLFERLKATGVVDVKNPVHQAMEEGRVEEVDDEDEKQ